MRDLFKDIPAGCRLCGRCGVGRGVVQHTLWELRRYSARIVPHSRRRYLLHAGVAQVIVSIAQRIAERTHARFFDEKQTGENNENYLKMKDWMLQLGVKNTSRLLTFKSKLCVMIKATRSEGHPHPDAKSCEGQAKMVMVLWSFGPQQR